MKSKLALWALGVASAVMAPIASADFVITATRANATNAIFGGAYEVITFRGFNNGLNGTGTKLLGVAAQLDSDKPFFFRMANVDADNRLDADIMMTPALIFNYGDNEGNQVDSRTTTGFSTSPASAAIGTAIRPVGGVFSSWAATKFIPTAPSSNPTIVLDAVDPSLVYTATPNSDPTQTYNNINVKSFRVEGAYLNGTNAPTANTGQGVIFAIAVVPTGATVSVSGLIAGDTAGDKTLPTTTSAGAPEPGTFAVLGIGAIGALTRRRRKA